MEYLGLHNKPKAELHPEHLLMGPKEEEEEEEGGGGGGGGGGGPRGSRGVALPFHKPWYKKGWGG
jgi:hypothetical protein